MFAEIVSPPFGDVTRTTGGSRPRRKMIVLFRMSALIGSCRPPIGVPWIPVNSNAKKATRLGAPHQTHDGFAVPLGRDEIHLTPAFGGTSPVFVRHTYV